MPITERMGALLSEPISPELALVCPELRARAIAALVELERATEVETARRRPASAEYTLMSSLADQENDDDWVPPLPVAILAYAAASTTRFAVEAAAVVAVLIGLVSIMAQLHS